MITHWRTRNAGLAIVGIALLAACSEGPPTVAHTAHEGHEGHFDTALLSAHQPVEVQQAIARLREWSAPFHNLEKAREAEYTVDGRVELFEPQFLVYAPHPRDAHLPKEERLEAARLAGFDYFVPGALWPHEDPPEFFGEPFNWSDAFEGWMRHIYLWAHNPEGMFEDFNAHIPLCTTHLDP